MTFVKGERAKGPVLLVDAGDALTAMGFKPEDATQLTHEHDKAFLILKVMGELGYQAMAVGERDVLFGVDELVAAAEKAKVPLLAANLVRQDGSHPFGERRIVEVGGQKVGVFAVSEGPQFADAGLQVQPAEATAKSEVEALRKEGATYVLGLFHMPFESARTLVQHLQGVDMAIASHESRTDLPHFEGQTFFVAGGDRGRSPGRTQLVLDGKGAFVDLSGRARAKQEMDDIDESIRLMKERIGGDPTQKTAFGPMLERLQTQRADAEKRLHQEAPPGGRSVLSEFVDLGPTIADDPAVRAEVNALTGAAVAPAPMPAMAPPMVQVH